MIVPLAPLLGAVALAGPAQDESTTRAHDLSAFAPPPGAVSIALDLAPRPFAPFDPEPDPAFFDLDALVEVVGHLLDPGKADAPKLELQFDGSFLVTGTAAQHTAVDHALEQIRAACSGGEMLEVRVVAGLELPDGPLLLDAAASDRRIAELVASGKGSVRKTGSTALRDGVVAAIRALEVSSFVADQEVEIAHGSVIYDPITLERSDGLEVQVRAARRPGATWLDLALRWSEPAAPMRRLTVRPKVWLATPEPHENPSGPPDDMSRAAAATFHGEIPLAIECPRTRRLGLAGSFLLPDGQALWFPWRGASAFGAAALAIELRVRGPSRPATASLALASPLGKVNELAIVHLGAWTSAGVVIPRPFPESCPLGPMWPVQDEKKSQLWPSAATSETAGLRIDAASELTTSGDDGRDGLFRQFSPDAVLVDAPAALRERIVRELAPPSVLGAPIEIAGRVTRGDETIAEFTLPSVTGRVTSLWAGVDGSYLADWDVDVANQAQVANPEMGWFFDGLVARLFVEKLRDERLLISIDGLVQALDAPPALRELPDPYCPLVEEVAALRLPLAETCVAPLVDGKAVVRLGGLPLCVELTVRPLPPPPAANEPAAAASDASGAPATRSRRRFDVLALVAARGSTAVQLDLCPRFDSNVSSNTFEDRPEREPLGSVEALVDLLEHAFRSGESDEEEPEIEADGRFVVVTGSDAQQARVEPLLSLAEAALFGEERLELRVVEFDDAHELPFDRSLGVDVAESDRRLAELAQSKRGRVVRVGSASLALGSAGSIRQFHARARVKDHEAEIAHGAAIYDPIIESESLGLAASFCADRVDGATRLDLAVRDLEPDAPCREQVARPVVWLSSPLPPQADAGTPLSEHEATVVMDEVPLQIDQPLRGLASFAGSLQVPDGQAMWIPLLASSRAGRGVSGRAIEVRIVGKQRPEMRLGTTAGDAGRETGEVQDAIWQLGARGSHGFQATATDARSLAVGFLHFQSDETGWPSQVEANGGSPPPADLVVEAIPGIAPFDGSGEAQLASLWNGSLWIRASAATRTRIRQELDRRDPPRRALALHGRVLRDGATTGEFHVPLLSGRLATVWSGVEGGYLADWDVDVAGESMIGNPEIGAFLDGCALRFVVESAGDARVRIWIRGVVESLDGPPVVQGIANPYTPFIEKVDRRRLVLDDTRDLPCTGAIAKTRFGGDALALEVTIELK